MKKMNYNEIREANKKLVDIAREVQQLSPICTHFNLIAGQLVELPEENIASITREIIPKMNNFKKYLQLLIEYPKFRERELSPHGYFSDISNEPEYVSKARERLTNNTTSEEEYKKYERAYTRGYCTTCRRITDFSYGGRQETFDLPLDLYTCNKCKTTLAHKTIGVELLKEQELRR